MTNETELPIGKIELPFDVSMFKPMYVKEIYVDTLSPSSVATASNGQGADIDSRLSSETLLSLKLILGCDPIDIGMTLIQLTADICIATGQTSNVVLRKLGNYAKSNALRGATESELVMLLTGYAAGWIEAVTGEVGE